MARTKAQIVKELEAVSAAFFAVLQGQEYRIGNRLLTRADFSAVTAEKRKLERELASIEAGGRGGLRVRQVLPRDY